MESDCISSRMEPKSLRKVSLPTSPPAPSPPKVSTNLKKRGGEGVEQLPLPLDDSLGVKRRQIQGEGSGEGFEVSLPPSITLLTAGAGNGRQQQDKHSQDRAQSQQMQIEAPPTGLLDDVVGVEAEGDSLEPRVQDPGLVCQDGRHQTDDKVLHQDRRRPRVPNDEQAGVAGVGGHLCQAGHDEYRQAQPCQWDEAPGGNVARRLSLARRKAGEKRRGQKGQGD